MVTIYVMLFMGIVITLILCLIFLQWRNKRAVNGKLYCTILDATRAREERLLLKDNNKVTLNKPGGGLEHYYINPSKTFTMLYPPNMPKILQVTVQSAVFARGNPEPLDPYNTPPVVTSKLLGNVQDEKFSELMLREAKLREKSSENQRQGKFDTIILILVAVAALGSIGSVMLAFVSRQSVAEMLIMLEKIADVLGAK